MVYESLWDSLSFIRGSGGSNWHQSFIWNAGISIWGIGFSSSGLYYLGVNAARFTIKRLPFKSFPAPLNGWTDFRDIPNFADQSCPTWWYRHRKSQEDEG